MEGTSAPTGVHAANEGVLITFPRLVDPVRVEGMLAYAKLLNASAGELRHLDPRQHVRKQVAGSRRSLAKAIVASRPRAR